MTPPTTSPPIPGAAQSFRDWSHAKPLAEALSRAEAAVRVKPQDAPARCLLFELLCVLGQWARALKQLQTLAGLSPDFDNTAHVMRGLIRAERQRVDVLAGRTAPATVTVAATQASAWMAGLAKALQLAGQGKRVANVQPVEAIQASDQAREAAWALAPDTPGSCTLGVSGAPDAALPFDWITDSDTRIGPVCEVILLGAYRWLPFCDIASLTKAAPQRLLDLVWSQADVVLRDGTTLKGYLPMRYPVQSDGLGDPADRDALLLGRETVWQEVGRTGVHARGQKMWAIPAGDLALLDIRTCHFVAMQTAQESQESQESQDPPHSTQGQGHASY